MEAIGGPDAALYGELTPIGFRKLATSMNLGASDSFVDLGSGLGRLCVQAAKEFNVSQSFGVEYAQSRHELAAELLADEDETIAQRVTLIQGDCADATLWASGGPLDGVTVVFAGSLMFSSELMDRLARAIESSATPPRIIASLKQWPDEGDGGGGGPPRGFRPAEPHVERCESSWVVPRTLDEAQEEVDSPVYVYVREIL